MKTVNSRPTCIRLIVKENTSLLQVKFLHPKYWAAWFVFVCMLFITQLPHQFQMKIGAGLGWLGYKLMKVRRHIVEVNIRLCFPELSASDHFELTRKTFRSSGIGLIETANAWIKNPNKLRDRVSIKGLDNLKQALDLNKGVLLIGIHFSTLDLCGAVLSSYVGFDVMYRRNKNELVEAIMTRGRQKNFPNAIERHDIRSVLKSLKNGHAVWYGPDQDYGRKHSVFAPFFGIEAATITATARFARISGSTIILFSHYRDSQDEKYVIELSQPIENFPSDNEVEDATLINQYIEAAVRKAPDQYWWVHRRFKTRPNGEARPY